MSTGRISCWTRVLFFRPATASDSGITACNTEEEEDDCSIVLKKKIVISVLKVLPHFFCVTFSQGCLQEALINCNVLTFRRGREIKRAKRAV